MKNIKRSVFVIVLMFGIDAYAETSVIPLQKIEMDVKELKRVTPRRVKREALLEQIRQRGKEKEALTDAQKEQEVAEDRLAVQRNANYVRRIADKIALVEQRVSRYSAEKAGKILAWSKQVQAAKKNAQKAANKAKEPEVGVYVKFALNQTLEAVEGATKSAQEVEKITGMPFLAQIPKEIEPW